MWLVSFERPHLQPGQPEVADLELAVGVGQNIFGLDVAVEDAACRERGEGGNKRSSK